VAYKNPVLILLMAGVAWLALLFAFALNLPSWLRTDPAGDGMLMGYIGCFGYVGCAFLWILAAVVFFHRRRRG